MTLFTSVLRKLMWRRFYCALIWFSLKYYSTEVYYRCVYAYKWKLRIFFLIASYIVCIVRKQGVFSYRVHYTSEIVHEKCKKHARVSLCAMSTLILSFDRERGNYMMYYRRRSGRCAPCSFTGTSHGTSLSERGINAHASRRCAAQTFFWTRAAFHRETLSV